MEKVVRDGKVAVLISPGFGSGWSTWDKEHIKEKLFDPTLIALVEQGASYEEKEKYVSEKWPDDFNGGLQNIRIVWIPIGTRFRVDEYDGAEYIVTENNLPFVA